jgi:hypothetical protein
MNYKDINVQWQKLQNSWLTTKCQAQEENFSRQHEKIRSKCRTMQTLNCIENQRKFE